MTEQVENFQAKTTLFLMQKNKPINFISIICGHQGKKKYDMTPLHHFKTKLSPFFCSCFSFVVHKGLCPCVSGVIQFTTGNTETVMHLNLAETV